MEPTAEVRRELSLPWLAGGCAIFLAGSALHGMLARWHEGLPLPHGFDPILQSLPRVSGDWLCTWGFVLFHPAVGALWARRQPRRLPFCLAVIGFWIGVRAVFIALNPVGPPADLKPFYMGDLRFLRGLVHFDTELFFSGHTGMPYLYFLLSPGLPRLRAACLVFSLLMGAGVLLTRNHFLIDVLGAYFMTYSIWALAGRLFRRLEPLP